MKPLLHMQEITKRYSGVTALNNVELTLNAGEVLALVGENGAGKSTLIKVLGGIISRDSGTILIDGKEADIKNPIDAQKCGIRSVQQHFSLIPTMSVAENLYYNDFPLKLGRRIDFKAMNKKAAELLQSLGFGDINPASLISNLSVANAQRVEVAKAIKFTPKILILDEPSAVLPEKDVNVLFDVIRKLKAQGVGIIYISHHMNEVFEIADKISILKDGENVTTIEDVSSVDQYDLVRYMVGREIQNIYPPLHEALGDVVLKVSNLSTDKIHNISFELRRGEILGLAGLVGAGRTEVCRALFGLDKILSGTIELNGKPYAPKQTRDAIKAGFGFVTEDRHFDGLILGDSVERNISFVGLKKQTKHGCISDKRIRKTAEYYVDLLKIATSSPDKLATYLSGGNQQKVVLSKWLFTDPQIFLIDEGTRGIDVNAKHEIYELMHEFVKNGKSIVMVSSELPEIMQMSNRINVMREGEIVAEFSHSEATEEAIIRVASGL